MASSTKTDSARYDRQLRLWGEEGQSRLESSKIALLNATAAGCETLKNLVLPGIGHFVIVDGHKVTEADLGNNFFVEASSIGQSRAKVTCTLLNELNNLVTGEHVEKDPVALIHENPNYFAQFTIIIASNLPEEPLLKLARVAYAHDIPLLSIRSYGLVGLIRVAVPEHTVVESKPDNPADDLRITSPFPTLQAYAESVDPEKMNSTEHSHIAYPVLLLKYLKKWKETVLKGESNTDFYQHDGKLPSNYSEKNEFRNIVIRGSKNPSEENFSEAYNNALKLCVPYKIPSQISDILNDAKTNITKESSKFWILVHAVKGFVENEGQGFLPLQGNLSDMKATTEGFIALQTIYQTKANEDIAAVTHRVKETLHKIGKIDWISDQEIKTFCRNTNFLRVIRHRSLDDERNPKTAKSSLFSSQLSSPPEDTAFNIVWYFAIRAADRFYSAHNRYPGSEDSTVHADVEELNLILKQLLAELNISASVDEKYIKEIVRFGASELHPIASFVGGVASQEVIKLITHMYTAMNNTFIFNGLNSTSLTLEV